MMTRDCCVLSLILAPWHRLAEGAGKGVQSWAYADDRSLKAADDLSLVGANEATEEFDASIGLIENTKKRQSWRKAEKVELL